MGCNASIVVVDAVDSKGPLGGPSVSTEATRLLGPVRETPERLAHCCGLLSPPPPLRSSDVVGGGEGSSGGDADHNAGNDPLVDNGIASAGINAGALRVGRNPSWSAEPPGLKRSLAVGGAPPPNCGSCSCQSLGNAGDAWRDAARPNSRFSSQGGRNAGVGCCATCGVATGPGWCACWYKAWSFFQPLPFKFTA